MYFNSYTKRCHESRQEQVDFLSKTFSESKAEWKFLQVHHPYYSAAENVTDLQPLIEIVTKHHGTVLNGHDHCMGHFYGNNTNFVLSGGAGYPQAGDCNNGAAPGPYAKFLGANSLSGRSSEFGHPKYRTTQYADILPTQLRMGSRRWTSAETWSMSSTIFAT